MSNNPNIVEDGRATRFSKSGDGLKAAKEANKKALKKQEENRSMRSTMQLLANTPMQPGKAFDVEKIKSLAEVNGKNLTPKNAVALKILMGAINDDPECRRLFLELSGAMAEDKAVADAAAASANDVIPWNRLFDLVGAPFLSTLQADLWGLYDENVLKGGRGSLKSSFASILVWCLLKKHPDVHAAVFRKVGNTLRNSVFAQMEWALNELEPGKWKRTVNPMEMTNKETGQKILFFGMDDPGKLKSIKLPFGYIGVLWFEELDQYSGPEEIRNVEQSCLRGGSFAFTIKSFNPPMTARNWANQYALEQRPKKLVQHTDYRTSPADWLGQSFIERAEYLRETNPTAYAHEYLGEVTGCGTEVFTNVQISTITDGQIKSFDRAFHGIDWGWYPDPWAFNSCYYDAARKALYIYDELTRNRTSNEDTFKLLQAKHICEGAWETLTADSAEPKSCADYNRWGLKCISAIKGPGSVEQGCKWLQSLEAIVIDSKRCPDTAKEFLEYEYEVDTEGNPLPGYPDYANHHIDAVRYALERVWRRPGE